VFDSTLGKFLIEKIFQSSPTKKDWTKNYDLISELQVIAKVNCKDLSIYPRLFEGWMHRNQVG